MPNEPLAAEPRTYAMPSFTTLNLPLAIADALEAFLGPWERRWVELEAQRWVRVRLGLPVDDLDEEQATIVRLHGDARAVIEAHRASAAATP